MELERKSDAVEGGKTVSVNPASTVVLTDTDTDEAVKFYICNESDTDITLRYATTAPTPGHGIMLRPGQTLEEDRYAGPVSACHAGTGAKDLGVVIV